MKQLGCISFSDSNLKNVHPKCLDNIFVYMLPKEIIMNVLNIIGNITIGDFSLFEECYKFKNNNKEKIFRLGMEDILERGLQQINIINLENYTKNILNKKIFPNNKNQVLINSENLQNNEFYFIVNNIIVEEDIKLKNTTKKYTQTVHDNMLLEVVAKIINKRII